MKKVKRIAKFEGLEPRRCEDIKRIVVPDIGPKSFGTFEKQAPGLFGRAQDGDAFEFFVAEKSQTKRKKD